MLLFSVGVGSRWNASRPICHASLKIKSVRNQVVGLKCNNVIAFDIVKAAKGYWIKQSLLLSWKEVLFLYYLCGSYLYGHRLDCFTSSRSDNSQIIPFMEC